MPSVGRIRNFAFAALFVSTALLLACTRTSATAPPDAAPALVAFASDEGWSASPARVRRPISRHGEPVRAQYNGLFCGPTSAAIVLNAVRGRSADFPRDHSRLRKEDLQF
jgi:hypothetical protein